ncbi:ABC transporter substrate-binding protein [Egbenema bharatensis]|uniref:ABC transporter substrate-binding protein n=1 Tax=Egbenema bharatensis TaxID=3463334 RepID=UPI003A880336
MKRRKFLKYTTTAGAAFTIAACTNRQTTSSSSGQAGSLEDIKIAILTWVGYGPFFIAKEQGFFEQYGLNAEILTIEDSASRRTALANQTVQFSISTLDMFAIEAAQGIPATCIMKLNDSYGADGIITTQDVSGIADLRGKSIAVEQGSPSHFFLLYLLEREGLTPDDVQIRYVPTAGDAAVTFAGNQADAAVTWEPYVSQSVAEKENGKILLTSREQLGLLLDLLTVNSDYAQSNPEAVKGVLKAWFDAVAYWEENPEPSNAIMARGLGVDEQELAEMLKGTKFSDYDENVSYFGLNGEAGQYFEVFPAAQEIWLGQNLIEKTVSTEAVTDTSFLENLYS